MEVSAIAIQQATLQTATGLNMVKQQAQAEQAIVNVIQQTLRGQNLDICV